MDHALGNDSGVVEETGTMGANGSKRWGRQKSYKEWVSDVLSLGKKV